jgi:hypothetical protein
MSEGEKVSKWRTNEDGIQIPVPYTDLDVDQSLRRYSTWEALIPKEGFIRDFSYTYLGVEAHQSFVFWGAVFAISSVLKRQTWFDFTPLPPIYPNFFVVFVGPPASGKSTIIREVERLLSTYHLIIKDPRMQEIKRANILRSKATPEALMVILSKWKRTYIDRQGHEEQLKEPQSEAILVMSELDTFLGKQTYNSGLVSKLTDWYDCKDYDDDSTVKRGSVPLYNIFLNLLGGTTPDKLEKTLPEEAFGGGFMSRTILIREDVSQVAFPKPLTVGGAPKAEELQKRLAWIALNGTGQFTLSPEAEERYNAWYYEQHGELVKMEGTKKMNLYERLSGHLLRLAMVLRAQRYELGTQIEAKDLEAAIKVLNATYRVSYKAVEDVGTPQHRKWYNRAVEKLKNAKANGKRSLTRRELFTQLSPYNCRSRDLLDLVGDLFDQGLIDIQLDGRHTDMPTTHGREIYTWVGKVDE